MTEKKKKVLLAEANEAVRGIAEMTLRQNGFVVIAVSEASKVFEVLQFSRPDLIIVGGDLADEEGQPLFQRLQKDNQTASIPLLLFAAPDGRALPFPDEVIIPRPFNPNDFLERAKIFSGQATNSSSPAPVNPLGEAELNEDFLNAALGLDRIQVTESEVMDKTSITSKNKKIPQTDAFVGVDGHDSEDENKVERPKVESLMITDPQTDIRRPKTEKKKKEDLSTSGKLDILNDQYGLANPGSFDEASPERDHDYDWFVNEMQKEPPKDSPAKKEVSSKLSFDDPASMVDPVTPVNSSPPKPETKDDSFDNFIDELNQEIEKYEPGSKKPAIPPVSPKAPSSNSDDKQWQEALSEVTPAKVDLFTKQLASELAERIAAKIVDKIDSNKLMNLIKAEIISHINIYK